MVLVESESLSIVSDSLIPHGQSSPGNSPRASLVAQMVKSLPATWVQSLGQEDPLEKEMATHSSTLA